MKVWSSWTLDDRDVLKFCVPPSVVMVPEIEESEIVTVVLGAILPAVTSVLNSLKGMLFVLAAGNEALEQQQAEERYESDDEP